MSKPISIQGPVELIDGKRGLNEAMLDSMEKRFTVAGLDALTKFYGSKEGKSVMQKFGLYMADVMPVMQAEIAKAVAKAGRGS